MKISKNNDKNKTSFKQESPYNIPIINPSKIIEVKTNQDWKL